MLNPLLSHQKFVSKHAGGRITHLLSNQTNRWSKSVISTPDAPPEKSAIALLWRFIPQAISVAVQNDYPYHTATDNNHNNNLLVEQKL